MRPQRVQNASPMLNTLRKQGILREHWGTKVQQQKKSGMKERRVAESCGTKNYFDMNEPF